jgi:hypothetical protein
MLNPGGVAQELMASNTHSMQPKAAAQPKTSQPRTLPPRSGARPRTAWRRVRAAARGLLGALTLVGGFTWLLLNLHGTHPVLDSAVGIVLVAGGLVLLMPHRITLPRRVTGPTAIGVALAGTVASLAVQATQVTSLAYVIERGWPFHWLQRGGIADDPDTARRVALAADWQIDGVALGGDLLLWAYAGMLVLVVVVLVRRATRRR